MPTLPTNSMSTMLTMPMRASWLWFSRSNIVASAGEGHGAAGTPEDERQQQVDEDDGDDRGPDGPAHGHAHAGGTAAGVIAVVAVDQGHHEGEHDHLDDAVEDVDPGQV